MNEPREIFFSKNVDIASLIITKKLYDTDIRYLLADDAETMIRDLRDCLKLSGTRGINCELVAKASKLLGEKHDE